MTKSSGLNENKREMSDQPTRNCDKKKNALRTRVKLENRRKTNIKYKQARSRLRNLLRRKGSKRRLQTKSDYVSRFRFIQESRKFYKRLNDMGRHNRWSCEGRTSNYSPKIFDQTPPLDRKI
jgi:hypothetical protein